MFAYMTENPATIPHENPPAIVVQVFRSMADGVSSWVTKTPRGYAVTLRDDDAGETLPITRFFSTPEDATRYAKTLV